VHNDGPPIPPEKQSEIFQEGNRVGRHDPGDRRHQGLGLYIVERIVAAHEGVVSVTSSDAEGTTFTMRLPRQGGRTTVTGQNTNPQLTVAHVSSTTPRLYFA
jgi:signal transduction histidine kinase